MLSRFSVRGLALAFVLSAQVSPAFAGFEGRLTTPEGKPAAGYTLTVVGTSTSVPCGADGRFLLDPAPQPPFELMAASPEGEVAGPIVVIELRSGAVDLVLPAVLRDSVTVVSGLAPSLEVSPGNAATVVTQQQLEQRSPQRLVNVLDSIAGASKLDGGADGVPALRGLARGRTLILLDGARVTAERRAGPSGGFVEPHSLASVEVLRGPGSVVYGSDAFGGVINAISRDPDAGAFTLRFGADAGLGALDERAGYLAVAADLAGGGLMVNAHARDAENAEAGGGDEIFNSSYAGSGAALRYVHDLGPGRLRLGVSSDRSADQGKPASDSRVTRAYYPKEESDRFTASWMGVPAAGWDAIEASFFYGRYRLLLDRDRFATATANRRIDRSDVLADDASLRFVAGRPFAGGRLQLGLDAGGRFSLEAKTDRINFAADGETVASASPATPIEDAQQTGAGLFATWKRPLGARLTLDLGLRGDHLEAENRGGFFGDHAEQDTALSGNLALSAELGAGWSASLSGSQGFRSPTLSDRYFRGPSGRGFVIGNPDLGAESSRQFDLAVRYGRGRTALGIYAYHYTIEDLVERFPSGSNFEFRNRGEAKIRGLELEGQRVFSAHWSGDIGLAVADGEADGSDPIDDISPPNGWVTARYSFERGYLYGRVTAALAKTDPGPIEVERPGFLTYDLGAGYRILGDLEVRLIAKNLGDRRYIPNADGAATFAAGRSFVLALSGRIGAR